MTKEKLHFIFPSHPLRPKVVEETFADQYEAFRCAGYSVSTFPDAVIDEGKVIRGIPENSIVVYRGWMLDRSGYKCLHDAVESESSAMLTSTETYLASHHLPGWYEQLKDLTPQTVILPEGSDYEAEIKKLGWESYFIKDYVKSITTSGGSIIDDASQIKNVIQDFIDYRGAVEGGLCVRKVESFLPETEYRYFILLGKAYAPDSESVPQLIEEVAARIDAPFYSVDVIERDDGALRVVEIGDGQVSDLKSWTVKAFLSMWDNATI